MGSENEDFVHHIVSNGFVCDTEARGHATPGGRPPTEIVVDATEGFIPLWRADSMLRWRFQERSFAFDAHAESSKKIILDLVSEALLSWGSAAPVRFTRDDDLWDFEVVLRNAPDCTPAGCVLASAFFPNAGQNRLTIYPTMFEQERREQIETLIHEFGHVFGLRHFFANISENAWPSEIFGTHSPFTIMNYGAKSTLTAADLSDLESLYQGAWSGQLTGINGTPIRFVTPYSYVEPSVPTALPTPIQNLSPGDEIRLGAAGARPNKEGRVAVRGRAGESGMLGPSSADAVGQDFTDAHGRRWVAAQRIDFRDVDVAETEKTRHVREASAAPPPDPRTMARDDLARALQPRRLVGEVEYRLDEPDYEIADLILAMAEPPDTDGSWGDASAFARAKYLTGPGPAPDRFIVGADDRRRIDNPRFYPASAFAYLSQTCTATMIGPSTALCAAHCFYQNGTWIPTRSVTFGANTAAPTAPFGSFVFDTITMPGQWNSNEWDWDFAVLEFSPTRPNIGRQTGWFGTGQKFSGTKTMIGYPSDKPTPSSWIKSGTFTAAPGSRYEHNLDVIPGDSGAGTYDNGDGRVNGIQSTQWFTTNPPRVWNEVRRWDTTTYNFFHAYGNWPRN